MLFQVCLTEMRVKVCVFGIYRLFQQNAVISWLPELTREENSTVLKNRAVKNPCHEWASLPSEHLMCVSGNKQTSVVLCLYRSQRPLSLDRPRPFIEICNYKIKMILYRPIWSIIFIFKVTKCSHAVRLKTWRRSFCATWFCMQTVQTMYMYIRVYILHCCDYKEFLLF